jgi:hypothetical protein
MEATKKKRSKCKKKFDFYTSITHTDPVEGLRRSTAAALNRKGSEAQIQAKILHYIRTERHDIFAFKVVVANERGIPDIVLCKNGKFIALEVKQPDKCMSAIQAAQFQRLNAVGGSAIVVHSLEEFKEIVK